MKKSKINLLTAFIVGQFMFSLWLILSNRDRINNNITLAAIIVVLVAFYATFLYVARKQRSSPSELK